MTASTDLDIPALVRRAIDDADGHRVRPVDVVDPFISPKFCSCGERFDADTRRDLASHWYSHLSEVVKADPNGVHELEPF